jgi:hypothetical protein
LFAVTLHRASLAVTTIGDKATSAITLINVLKGTLHVIYPLLLATCDCLSTGLVGLTDRALGADPLGATCVCQNKLAWEAETMYTVVAKEA